MSLDTVVEDIRQEARKEAAAIREEADKEAEEIISQAKAEAEQIRQSAQEDVEAQIEREREQARSNAKLEARQQRLRARRDLLDAVYDSVAEALADLSGDKRRELTAALLDAARAEFSTEELVVYGRGADEALITELLTDNERFGGHYECLGGVVVEGPDGRIRANNTFDSLLTDIWEEQLGEISTRLFADSEQ